MEMETPAAYIDKAAWWWQWRRALLLLRLCRAGQQRIQSQASYGNEVTPRHEQRQSPLAGLTCRVSCGARSITPRAAGCKHGHADKLWTPKAAVSFFGGLGGRSGAF